MDNLVEDVFKVREEIDQEVDAVGCNGSLVGVDVHVNQCIAIVQWKNKQLVIIQGFADHKVDCQGVIIDIIKIQLNNRRFGDHWETGNKVGKIHIHGW